MPGDISMGDAEAKGGERAEKRLRVELEPLPLDKVVLPLFLSECDLRAHIRERRCPHLAGEICMTVLRRELACGDRTNSFTGKDVIDERGSIGVHLTDTTVLSRTGGPNQS
jgi:hypothetical protein